MLYKQISLLPKVQIIGKNDDWSNRAPILSVNFPHHDNAEIAFILSEKYGICTRSGLHCAPCAHKTLGTFPHGTLRLSLSHYNTEEEVDYCASALKTILQNNT